MANKITKEQIEQMNILYLQYHTYAAVAREMGCAPSTVKKYIVPNFQIVDEATFIRFDKDSFPEFNGERFRGVENFGDLTVLTEYEKAEIRELWKEIKI